MEDNTCVVKDLPKVGYPEDIPAWGKAVIDQITSQLNVINGNFKALIDSNQFVCNQIIKSDAEIKEIKDGLKKVQSEFVILHEENLNMRKENNDLRERVIKLETHQRKNNLVFYGIRERKGETDHDLYWKLVSAMNVIHAFRGNANRVRISRCHRIGIHRGDQPRPIIACLHWYGDKMTILNNRKQLPNGISVFEDFPKEIEERRKILRPILKKASEIGEYKGKCKLVHDKLILKGKAYSATPGISNLDELPLELQLKSVFQRESEEIIGFFGQGSMLSNFYPAEFTIRGYTFKNVEQFYQSEKARRFGDEVAYNRILAVRSASEAKMQGKHIRGYVDSIWLDNMKEVMKKGLLEKFSQNPSLKEYLLLTGSKVLAECSTDQLWGVGINIKDEKCLSQQFWLGQNLLGDCLMEIRSFLSSDN